MKVVITIPAYNEERTLPHVLKEIKEVMDNTEYQYEIIVVNDGSSDNTVEIAKKGGAKVFSNKINEGLAETFKHELRRCLDLNASIIVHTDADGQYPAHYIPKMIKKVEEGYDLVLGSRFGKGNYHGSLMKRLGNKAFAITFSNLLSTKLTDTTTGFRAFTQDVAQLPQINNFTYTQEQLIRAGKARMKIGEVPILARKTPRPSRLFKNSFDYALKAWINILRIYRDYQPLSFFGRIGFFFLFAGGSIGLWLFYRFITLGYVGRLPSTILSMLLILVGVQIILFGFLADMKRS